MKKNIITMLVALFIAAISLHAQTGIDHNATIPANPEIKIGTLPNGLKYYIRYNKKPENKVELRLAVNAGSILEDDSQQGLAHFMEHMNFNGLRNFPNNELVHYLQSIGVAFGNDLNAYTGFDETVYILPVPSDSPGKLDSAFMVIADWSGAALLTPEEIDKERGVILAESRLGKGADDRMMKKWLPALMHGSKYADRLPIGIDSIIEFFDHSVLHKFYQDWYRPGLQAVIVVGDIPTDEAEKKIIEKFSDFKNPEKPRERPQTFSVKEYKSSRAMVITDEEANSTSISLNGNPYTRRPVQTLYDYREKMINNLCFSMIRSRFDELRTSADPPFVYAYAYMGGWARGSENFGLGAMSGSTGIRKAVESIVVESMRVKKYGFTEPELKRAKASMLSEYEKRYNERDKTESERLTYELVNYFLEQDAIPGITWEFNFVKNHIDGITLEDFNAIRQKIDIDKSFFSYVTTKAQPGLPTDEQLKAWIEEALNRPVEPYKEKQIASSLISNEPIKGKIIKTEHNQKLGTTTYTLGNKVKVSIKPTDFKNDEILLKGSRFGGYSLYDLEDYQSAQWCSDAVENMGYGSFSNADLKKFLAGKIVRLRPVVDDYTESFEGSSSIKDIETLFQLLYLKSTSPRKDDAAFRSFITRSKQSLESLKQDPQYLFFDTAFNTFYQGNKRAHLIESAADYDRINLEHAFNFYSQRMGNLSNMHFTIVGSFTEQQIIPLIEKYIASIPAAEINANYKDIGLYPMKGSQSFTLFKGFEQQAMLAHFINDKMPYTPDDDFMLAQLNEVINIKIIDTIREKMSAIYGGGCGGSLQKYPREEFLVQSMFPCSPENIEKVNTAFLELIESTKKTGGITDLDWQKVREPALEQNEVDLKKNDYWLNSLQSAFLYGTDPERILTKEQRLRAIKPEQLVETARKFYSTPNIFKASWLPEKAE